MRKYVVATITAGVLALTACTSDNSASDVASGPTDAQVVVEPASDGTELYERLDKRLLSEQGAPSWSEVTEGWGRDVTGTEGNGDVFLVHTTFTDTNDRVDDAARIGNEVVDIVRDTPGAEQIGRVTVTYHEGRGAYSVNL